MLSLTFLTLTDYKSDQAGLPEIGNKRLIWGSAESDLYKTYLNLCYVDVDSEISQKMGIKNEEGQQKQAGLPSRADSVLLLLRKRLYQARRHRLFSRGFFKSRR